MSTPSPVADRNLIVGVLALQMDFVTREQLLDAVREAYRMKGNNLLGCQFKANPTRRNKVSPSR
jgi:hypothetical protein